MSSVRRRRFALYVLFFIPGLGIASWVTRTPAIRDLLGASTAEMGWVLFGLSAGSMIGILASGPLVLRLGARPVVAGGTASVVASMPLIGLGALTASPLLVATGLGFFGLGMGSSEVALNVEGAEVERIVGKPLLPLFHGFFSLGTLVGAVAGIAFTALDFSVVAHLLLMGAAALLAFLVSIRELAPRTGQSPRGAGQPAQAVTGASAGPTLWKDSRLLLIGALVLALALAEGTANDWLPLIMVDGHGFDEAVGSVVYAVFAASMVAGRFSGARVVQAFGRSRVLAASAVCAAGGLLLVSVVDDQLVAGLAVVLWGLGASLGFPLALSAAGDSGTNAAARVSLVSTVGYLAFLVGPPALGLLGDAVGLRNALLAPMIVVLLAAFLAPAARPRTHSAGDPQLSDNT